MCCVRLMNSLACLRVDLLMKIMPKLDSNVLESYRAISRGCEIHLKMPKGIGELKTAYWIMRYPAFRVFSLYQRQFLSIKCILVYAITLWIFDEENCMVKLKAFTFRAGNPRRLPNKLTLSIVSRPFWSKRKLFIDMADCHTTDSNY